MNFDACPPLILASEGGFVVDQGGSTNLGVAIPILGVVWRRPAAAGDGRRHPGADAGPRGGARATFHTPAHRKLRPTGPDLMLFDEAVDQGRGHALRRPQQALAMVAAAPNLSASVATDR